MFATCDGQRQRRRCDHCSSSGTLGQTEGWRNICRGARGVPDGCETHEVLKGELSSPVRVQKLIWLQEEPGPDPLRLLNDATVGQVETRCGPSA